MISKKNLTVNHLSLEEYTVSMENIEVSILNYGATVTSLKVPNKQGTLEKVVLSYASLEDYIKNNSFLNAIIGPTSGRIKDGLIHINNEQIQLDQNFIDKHHLHGGKECFAFQLFDINIKEYDDHIDVICSLSINTEDSYYPGNKDITITYIVEPNQLKIKFEGSTDEDTLLNMTSHLYFNLSGEKSDILNHYLMIDADNLIDLNHEFVPTNIKNVKDVSLDVTNPMMLKNLLTKELVSSHIKGIDHPFILNKKKNYDASLYDPTSQRHLQIKTTYPIIVCYTHNYPEEKELTNNTTNIAHQGICFETQYTPNHEAFKDLAQPFLKASEKYEHQTTYTFSIKNESK